MTADAMLLELVRNSVRGFAERHRDEIDKVDSGEGRPSPELLKEIAELGWLVSLSETGDSTSDNDEGLLLRCLVGELGRHSLPLATRLLVHHFCRVCVAPPNDGTATGSDAASWRGFDASVGDRRYAPPLRFDGSGALHGDLRFVFSGDVASEWLGLAEAPDGEVTLVQVHRDAMDRIELVTTLGLHGLGVSAGRYAHVGRDDYRTIATGAEVYHVVNRAYRVTRPGVLALIVHVLERTQYLVTEHARIRRQNGTLLVEIPAVAEMLDSIDRALALSNVIRNVDIDRAENAKRLLGIIAAESLHATDRGLQVLGGAGYIVGYELERLWRDVRQLTLFLPPSAPERA